MSICDQLNQTRRDFFSAAAATVPAGMVIANSDPAELARAEYLLDPGLTYLNTGSVGPTPRAVLDRMVEALIEAESNPVGMVYGQGALRQAADRARDAAAAFINADPADVLLTRSTSEAMNSVAQGLRLEAGDRVLTLDQEHGGGSLCWTYLARRRGVAVDVVPIPYDAPDPLAIVDRLEQAMRPETRVISVSHVLFTTGSLMPIAGIAALARSRGAICVVDGAQALGQVPVDVRALGCHAYAASGHKWLMGPKGTGLLYVSPDAAEAIQPIQREDDSRFFISESIGVGCLPLAVGLEAAIEAMNTRGMAAVAAQTTELRDLAAQGLGRMPKLSLLGVPPGPGATGMVSARLPDDIDARTFQQALRDRHGVIVKYIDKRWFNGIRLSTHVFNSEADVDRAIRAIRTELG